MTSAQPGQEQRMELCPREPTQEMLVAGRKQIFADMVGEHMGPNCERAWKAMFEARPTADLGEDGELIARLRLLANGGRFNAVPVVIQAADRIEQLREALVELLRGAETIARHHGIDIDAECAAHPNSLFAKARDVLSRSA